MRTRGREGGVHLVDESDDDDELPLIPCLTFSYSLRAFCLE